jgi:hypothetical protein
MDIVLCYRRFTASDDHFSILKLILYETTDNYGNQG